MRFYLDEAGSFSPPADPSRHQACVVMGVAVADSSAPNLEAKFRHFVDSLSADETVDGEPRGYLLTTDHEMEFCEILHTCSGISLTPVTLDLAYVQGVNPTKYRDDFREVLAAGTEKWPNREAATDWQLLAQQARNLSFPQLLRIHGYANCVQEALHHAIVFLSHGEFAASWHTVGIDIDRVQARPGSREERVFSRMMFSWLQAWSKERPQPTIREIHTADHPFVRNYVKDRRIDMTALLWDKISWVDSKESWGIQIADIAASIVYKAVQDLDDAQGAATRFGSLMRSSNYGSGRGPGLYSPTDPSSNEWIRGKYLVLQEMMRRHGSGGEGSV